MLTARASKILDLFYESFDRLISDKLILYIKGITQQLSIVMPPTLKESALPSPVTTLELVYEAHYTLAGPSPSPLTPLPQHRPVGRYQPKLHRPPRRSKVGCST